MRHLLFIVVLLSFSTVLAQQQFPVNCFKMYSAVTGETPLTHTQQITKTFPLYQSASFNYGLPFIITDYSTHQTITDAEILQKKFAPTFDAEDLTKLPNFQTITSVMINDVPSAAFSMNLIPPMVKPNSQLQDAIKKLSAAKYGRPRSLVEKEIFTRLEAGDDARRAKLEALSNLQTNQSTRLASSGKPRSQVVNTGSSFMDEWLAKREQIVKQSSNKSHSTSSQNQINNSKPNPSLPEPTKEELHVRNDSQSDDGISIRLR